MDYSIRAARAGFKGVWVKGAYVHRPPHSARRAREERAGFAASKRRYQDKFCGLHLRGEKMTYELHCRGDACPHFAPTGLIRLQQPLPALRAQEAQVEKTAPLVATVPSPEPLVSCIMPTHNRRHFLPRAIRCFQQQDYPYLELLVVDDGTDPISDCLPDDPSVRYVRLEGKRVIGEKRNIACEQARGEIVAHWDDDDWYPPGRVSAQVRALLDRQAEVCGSSQVLFYEPASDRAWRYRYVGAGGQWVVGSTLAYRRSFWARNPFAPLQIGEDSRFLSVARHGAVADLADPTLCVATIHAANTSRKIARGPYWHREAPSLVHQLLAGDLPPGSSALTATSQTVEAGAPLVSCVMPTYNRRPFLSFAISLFVQQDYPNKELIVVDDGEDEVGDLVEGHAGVRYIRLGGRRSIGAKRNLACAEARGEIIAHWDDDDWYAPNRLRYQAAPILAGEADLTGLANAFVLEAASGQFWTTHPELHRRMFRGDVHGGTLMFRHELLQDLRYPDINLAEDAWLLHQALSRGKRLARLANPGIFVYVRHGGNAWCFETGSFLDPHGWERIDPPRQFTSDDLRAYSTALASSRVTPKEPHMGSTQSTNTPNHLREQAVPTPRAPSAMETRSSSVLAVVVTCHEPCAKWLPDALVSIDRQSPAPAERVVAFDRCEPAGLPGPHWRSVTGNWGHPSLARNAGLAATTAPWVLFWDADNVMPEGYIAAMLQGISSGSPHLAILYPDIQFCDERLTPRELCRMPNWDYWDMRARNCVDTAAAWRREALEIVGGWPVRTDCGLEDYVLAMDVTKAGWKAARVGAPPVLMRTHPHSRTQGMARAGQLEATIWRARSLAIVSLLAGRDDLLGQWLSFLLEAELPAKAALYVVDNSGRPEFTRRAYDAGLTVAEKRRLSHLDFVTVGSPYRSSREEPYFVRERHLHVAQLYAS
ncbi:MAG: glycosyltransferase, partial [Chloroflexi bacterium]|nr:glycosyltransferase [Chloroflexota bacterium]